MKPRMLLPALALIVVVPAFAAMAREKPVTDAATYVKKAGAGDLYEMQSSRLALEKSQDGEIRDFAQMMIRDHEQTTQAVKEAAREAEMTPPPPALDARQQQMMAKLRSASAASFDRLYVEQQRKAHRMALDLHNSYSAHGDTPALRQAAASAVPVIQKHLDRLNTLNGGAGS